MCVGVWDVCVQRVWNMRCMCDVWVCIFVCVMCVVCMWCVGDCVGYVWDTWGFRNICVRVVQRRVWGV